MNNPYASLFGPRRMKPNPSESEAIRDPLGRGSTLWDQEEEEPDLNGKLESARADWRKDASLNSLFGVNGAFTLEDTVGKNGKNRPGDVFKVQSLLHREGLLDADKTAGPTGFLGLYDHEAIEKFQKENGLKVDGWMGPKGETIQAFQNFYAPVKSQPQQKQPQLPWKDYRPNLFDPKNWALWDKMDERERAFYAQQQEQETQQTETLSGGAGMDDAAPVQLAQQEDGLPQPQPQPQQSDAWSNLGDSGDRISGRVEPRTEENLPLEKRDLFKGRIPEWNAYEEAVSGLETQPNNPDASKQKITPNEVFAIMQTHAYEGGLRKDKSSTAYGGILQETLDEAKRSGTIEGLDKVETPTDLTPTQHAAVMHYYLNDAFGRIDGAKVLQDMPNKEVAAAVSDTLVRYGKNGGAQIIRDAITDRMKEKNMEIPDYYKDAQGRFGPAPLNDLKSLLKDNKEVGQFLEKLQDQRDKRVDDSPNKAGEMNRNRHFRFKSRYP